MVKQCLRRRRKVRMRQHDRKGLSRLPMHRCCVFAQNCMLGYGDGNEHCPCLSDNNKARGQTPLCQFWLNFSRRKSRVIFSAFLTITNHLQRSSRWGCEGFNHASSVGLKSLACKDSVVSPRQCSARRLKATSNGRPFTSINLSPKPKPTPLNTVFPSECRSDSRT